MVHARFSDEYIHFSLMYTTDNIFPVLPIKHLVNQDGEPSILHKMENFMKPLVSNPHVLFCTCVVLKATAHVNTTVLKTRHQSQNFFCGIFVGITQHQKCYLIYVPSTQKIVFSQDVLFDENVSSMLAQPSRPYSEALAIRTAVLYIAYTTSSTEQTGNIITFTQF